MDLNRFKLGNKQDSVKQQAWADWLSDAPPPATVRLEERARRRTEANTYVPRTPVSPVVPPSSQTPTGVSIQINLPQFHKPQFRRTKVAWATLRPQLTRRRIITVTSIIVIVGGLWGTLAILKQRHDHAAAQAALTAIQQATPQVRKLAFTPAVPSTEQQLAIPDNVRAKFDPSKNNYSFVDLIANKQLTVSEQPLASSDVAKQQVISAAKLLHATVPLNTGWGTAYIATNQKYNSQTVVVSVRELLIFLQSPFSFTNDQWATYINSLQ